MRISHLAPRRSRKVGPRRLAAATAIALLFAAQSGSTAAASTAGQGVSGLTLETLSLSVPTPVVLSGLAPGTTATGTGALIVISTKGSWSLSVQDEAGGTPGHMAAAASGCSGSESSLISPLTVHVTSLLGGVGSSGIVPISGSAQTVATGAGVLGTAALSTAYSQSVASSETLLAGCSYSLTATYTLQ